MPAPAGTGLSRRSFLLRTGGLALSVYGASLLDPRALRGGDRQGGRVTSDPKVLVSVFLEGGIDALSVLAPVEDPRYRQLRPKLGLDPASRSGLERGPAAALASGRDAAASAPPGGQGHRLPGDRLRGADQSHFTSRHYWEVGELNTNANTGWLGRLLDVVGSADNPLQGDLPRRLARAQPGDRSGSRSPRPGAPAMSSGLRERLGRCRGR